MYHVINRSVGRGSLFITPWDYAAFENVLRETKDRVAMRLLAYCVMPNHWHLVLWPDRDGDLSEFMRLLTVTHAQRWHAGHGTSGTGALYQGRFKSFPIKNGEHFYTVCRYVERNALRANLVARAEGWRWSSAWHRAHCPLTDSFLDDGPEPLPKNWLEILNSVQHHTELAAIRNCVNRGAPYGDERWRAQVAAKLGLLPTLRPKKGGRESFP